MNHDYAHCLDYNVDCPNECFRGQLVRDVRENHPFIVVSWMSFEGTDECMKEKKDVVEVVRCKDCKYGEVDDADFPDQYLCHHHGSDWNEGNHYCSYGERKGE